MSDHKSSVWPYPIWPVGCHDTDSCERHRICMYHQCVHTGKGMALGNEIDAAVIARPKAIEINDNFAIIRRALGVPGSAACPCEKCEAERNAPAALTAIEAKLADLRNWKRDGADQIVILTREILTLQYSSDKQTLAAWMNANGFLAAPTDPIGDMLAELSYVVGRLRENALDWSKVPVGWEFVSLDVMADTGFECTLRRSGDDLSDDVYGGGSTPSAAMAAAVGKIGGGG